jgi:hypothetical protein
VRLLIALALIAGCEKQTPPPTPVVEQPPAAAPKRFADQPSLPGECLVYQRAIHDLHKCEKFPQPSIDALKDGFAAMIERWGRNQSMSVEARTAIANGCAAGTDAVKQAVSAICGDDQPPRSNDDDRTVPPECLEYRRMLDLIDSCDKLPIQAREAIKQGFEQVSQTWRRRSYPPEARAAIAKGCKQSADTLRQVAANACDLQQPTTNR